VRFLIVAYLVLPVLLAPAASPIAKSMIAKWAGGDGAPVSAAFQTQATLQFAQTSLSPGSDLTQASSQAADGATIALAAGTYPGVIYVKGKRLTIKGDPGGGTVLTGTDAQMIVQVVEGGKLELSHVTFQTRPKDGLAAFINKAEAEFADCQVSGTIQPAFYVDGGRLAVIRCQFRDLQDVAIAGVNQSTVILRDSAVSNAPQGGVALIKGSKGEITGTNFDNVGRQAIRASEGASVTVANSQIANSDGRGVEVAGGSADIATTRFENLANIGVLGAAGARIAVSDSDFSGLSATAIHMEQGARLAVEGSRFSNVEGAVLTAEGETAVTLAGNTIQGLPGDRPALAIQTSGPLEIRGNVITDANAGILLLTKTITTAAEISGNTLTQIRDRGISVQAGGESGGAAVRLSDNRVLGTGGSAVLLDASPAIELTGNLLLSTGAYGVVVQNGASVTFEGNLMAGPKGAVLVHAGAGSGSRMGSDILIGEAIAEGPLQRQSIAAKLEFIYADPDKSQSLARAHRSVLGALAAGGDDLTAAVQTLAAAAEDIRARAKDLAAIELHTVDRLGMRFAAAFSVYDRGGDEIFIGDAVSQTAIVEPGLYVVEPHLDPSQTVEMTVEPGETKVLDSQLTDYQVLQFYSLQQDSPPVAMPLALKSAIGMARALAGYRDNFPFEVVAVSRPGAIAAARKQALNLARQALAGMQPRFVALTPEFAVVNAKTYDQRSDEENAAFNKVSAEVQTLNWDFILPAKILTALGEESDARDLVDGVIAADLHADKRVAVAAYIENRLGILDRGAVAELLTGTNPVAATWAAIYLKYFGIDTGISVLVDTLHRPTDASLTDRAARALLGTAHQDVVAGMRSILEARLGPNPRLVYSAALPAAAYLLVHGDDDDRRRVTEFKMGSSAAPMLTLLASDPNPLIGYMSSEMLNHDAKFITHLTKNLVNDLAEICPLIRDLPAAVGFAADSALEDAVVDLFVKFNLSGRTSNSDRKSGRTLYSLAASQCRASGATAAVAFEKNDVFLEMQNWIPRPWARAKAIEGAWFWNYNELDLMAHQALVDAVTQHHPAASEKREMYLAYHAVAASLGIDNQDRLPGGAERRAVLVRNEGDPPGALASVVAMRPEILDNTLRVALEFDLASHTESSLASMIDPPKRSFQHYLAGRGKNLIKTVNARRGDRVFPLTAAGEDSEGRFIFETDLDRGELRDLELDVVLQVFETQWALTFGLYASDYGRSLNGALSQVAVAQAASAAAPGDPALEIAWGDALRAAGRLSEARKHYEAVLAGDPGNVDLWFALSDMYVGRSRHSEAVPVLQAAVAAVPDDAGLRFELANSLYLSGVYAQASDAFAKLAELEPDDARWRWWQATNRFLAGDPGPALIAYLDAPEKYQRRRTALLRYIAASLAGDEADVTAAKAVLTGALSGREETAEGLLYRYYLDSATLEQVFAAAATPAQQCQAHVFSGYGHLLAGDKQPARERMESALAICRTNKLEYRLADAELGRLPAAQ